MFCYQSESQTFNIASEIYMLVKCVSCISVLQKFPSCNASDCAYICQFSLSLASTWLLHTHRHKVCLIKSPWHRIELLLILSDKWSFTVQIMISRLLVVFSRVRWNSLNQFFTLGWCCVTTLSHAWSFIIGWLGLHRNCLPNKHINHVQRIAAHDPVCTCRVPTDYL